MAHINTNEAQQAGAFNNGAVGQQYTPLCQWPYVWDRVRKACVLPDEWDWAYEGLLPWGWGEQFTNPARGNELFSYGPPVMSNEGVQGLGAVLAALGACPEGSSTKYSGTRIPGTDCYCAPGRVVHNGYCQSPQSVVQQSSASISDYAQMSVAEQMAQPLSDYAKEYFRMTKHSVSCKLVYPTAVPGGPNHPTMMCSIDGGPYSHGAYAINLNPQTAITSAIRSVAVEQVAKQQGVAPGSVYQHRSGREAVDAAVRTMEIQTPPTSVDTGTQGSGISTLPPPPQGSMPAPGGGYDLPDGTYAPPGQYAEPGGGMLDGLGDIPWYVWAAVAGGAYMVMKKK